MKDSRLKLQEAAAGHTILCATVVLDGQPGLSQQRLGAALYEACRSKRIELPSFPEFDPVVNALKGCGSSDLELQLKVTVVRGDKLCILQSLARKWLEYDKTRELAQEVIGKHNTHFCHGEPADYLEDDERTQFESRAILHCFVKKMRVLWPCCT